MGVERSTYLLVCSDAELCATFDKIMDRTIIDEDGHKLCTYAVNKVGTTRKLVMNQHGTIVSFEVDKGYPRLRLSPLSSASPLASVANGKGPMVFAHHVVYAWSHKNVRNTDEFKSRWLDPSLDISHLSARPDDNCHRDACHAFGYLIMCPHCEAILDPCCHEPKCRKRLGTTNPPIVAAHMIMGPPAPGTEPSQLTQPSQLASQLTIATAEATKPEDDDDFE